MRLTYFDQWPKRDWHYRRKLRWCVLLVIYTRKARIHKMSCQCKGFRRSYILRKGRKMVLISIWNKWDSPLCSALRGLLYYFCGLNQSTLRWSCQSRKLKSLTNDTGTFQNIDYWLPFQFQLGMEACRWDEIQKHRKLFFSFFRLALAFDKLRHVPSFGWSKWRRHNFDDVSWVLFRFLFAFTNEDTFSFASHTEFTFSRSDNK
jgi:hypothetical protein